MDVCDEHGLDPSKVVVDHNNEETVRETLDRGYWAAFSIYPSTKMGNSRMVEILRRYGANANHLRAPGAETAISRCAVRGSFAITPATPARPSPCRASALRAASPTAPTRRRRTIGR